MALSQGGISKKKKKKKMTEGEGETDTQHFNSFIRLDTSCIIDTQRLKRSPGHASCTRISSPNGSLINVEHAFIPVK